jgi:hypothetical protein
MMRSTNGDQRKAKDWLALIAKHRMGYSWYCILLFNLKFCFEWTLVSCYDGKAGVSLLKEAQTKGNESDNAEGRFCPRALSGFKENLFKQLVMQESVMDPNAMKRTSKLWCGVVLSKSKLARASVTTVTMSPYCINVRKLVLGGVNPDQCPWRWLALYGYVPANLRNFGWGPSGRYCTPPVFKLGTT